MSQERIVSEPLALEEPHPARGRSYRELVAEFVAAGEPLIPFTLTFESDDIPALVARLEGCSRGEGLPSGFVANSTFWLVRDGEVVGVSNLRHELTPSLKHDGGHIGYGVRPSARMQGFGKAILRMTLERARAKGLQRVLLTCDSENEASVRTILANGGRLTSEEFVAERQMVIQRYWIDLADRRTA